eukprot:CAMPEP_0116008050 /NCGR_PEP_ID=MMETSP0321-20121206/2643_1 /TAXON_ID=163516 /ORGANISM="Leptocylindrus danicus var. danicus, Strain B650" /LENGTH=712 /DNA_ID=CAMNT_0003476821 /DNA_START=165 /DNA_END=2304 /DNA_ORIENTATION=-
MSTTTNNDPLAARELTWAINPEEILAEHTKINGPIVRTRFPPEPNGYLHIGHAKSMNMNFKLAFEKLGVEPANRRTIFRYDDTNPEAESAEYIASLERDVRWMGWEPERTTYSSELFQQLFDYAIVLIKKGLAYVCDFDKATVEKQRDLASRRAQARNSGKDPDEVAPLDPALIPGPNRNRSVAENLDLFHKMAKGFFKEGQYTLRMKMDLDHSNPNMYDLMAYRIKYVPHPHIGDVWCIYPTYDFTHSICDSLEHIDYSICTLEFERGVEPYFWVLWALDLYRPKVYEMSRLNLAYTVLSKRRLLKLVNNGYMRGWDDCRMPTISGLRRRGYTPDIINTFCTGIGATRAMNVVEVEKLSSVARVELGAKSRRCLSALTPVKVKIVEYVGCTAESFDDDANCTYEVQNSPTDETLGCHMLKFTPKCFYVDLSDFGMDNDGGNFYGLTPDQHVGLKYVGANLHVSKLIHDKSSPEKLVEIEAKLDLSEGKPKPKSHISWCPSDSVKCEVRVYNNLFVVPEPSEKWEEELNPQSEIVYPNALVDPSVLEVAKKIEFSSEETGGKTKVTEDMSGGTDRHFQFERLGYFIIDLDSARDAKSGAYKLVFNRTVNLREDIPVKAKSATSAKDKEKLEARKVAQAKQLAAKEARLKISPENLFKEADEYKGLYSAFDGDGIPTHDAAGEKLTKSAMKNLKKEQAKHVKQLKVKAMKEGK